MYNFLSFQKPISNVRPTPDFLELPFHPTRLLIYEKCGETLNPETLAAQLVSNQFMAVRQVERPDIGDLSSLMEGGLGWKVEGNDVFFNE